jgi:hypothetical protein
MIMAGSFLLLRDVSAYALRKFPIAKGRGSLLHGPQQQNDL